MRKKMLLGSIMFVSIIFSVCAYGNDEKLTAPKVVFQPRYKLNQVQPQDACSSSPCQNDALCVNQADGSYKCECREPYTGKNCDEAWNSPCTYDVMRSHEIVQFKNPWDKKSYMVCLEVNAHHTIPCSEGTYFDENLSHCIPEDTVSPLCEQNSCTNGGTCVKANDGTLVCLCPTGFTGDKCETNIDDCAVSGGYDACYGGTCIDQVNAYYCMCEYGIGTNCKQTISNPCTAESVKSNRIYSPLPSADFNYYVHCSGVNSYKVKKCPDGLYWQVEHNACGIDKSRLQATKESACSSYPCKNGGQCQEDGDSGYKCTCASGYAGETCEQVIDHCQSNPCKNGGQCHGFSGGYVCVCKDYIVDDCCCNGISNPCPSKSQLVPGLNNYFPHIFKNRYIHCDFDGRAFVRKCPENLEWNQDITTCVPSHNTYADSTQTNQTYYNSESQKTASATPATYNTNNQPNAQPTYQNSHQAQNIQSSYQTHNAQNPYHAKPSTYQPQYIQSPYQAQNVYATTYSTTIPTTTTATSTPSYIPITSTTAKQNYPEPINYHVSSTEPVVVVVTVPNNSENTYHAESNDQIPATEKQYQPAPTKPYHKSSYLYPPSAQFIKPHLSNVYSAQSPISQIVQKMPSYTVLGSIPQSSNIFSYVNSRAVVPQKIYVDVSSHTQTSTDEDKSNSYQSINDDAKKSGGEAIYSLSARRRKPIIRTNGRF